MRTRHEKHSVLLLQLFQSLSVFALASVICKVYRMDANTKRGQVHHDHLLQLGGVEQIIQVCHSNWRTIQPVISFLSSTGRCMRDCCCTTHGGQSVERW